MTDLFSFFRTKQLKPKWQFDAGTIIWRLLAANDRIVGECRNGPLKYVSFFCLDAYSGRPLWKDIKLEEHWWIGIEMIHNSWLILHGYNRPDMPEHRGIWVMEIETGNVSWINTELTFWFVKDEIIYCYKQLFEKRIVYELDINTGRILNEYSDNLDVLYELRKNTLQEKIYDQNNATFPELFDREQKDSLLKSIIFKITGENVLSDWIEYSLLENILFICYFHQEETAGKQLLDNYFVVYNMKNKRTLFKEIIGKGLQVPSLEKFFLKDKFAYFLKNQNILTALQPWK